MVGKCARIGENRKICRPLVRQTEKKQTTWKIQAHMESNINMNKKNRIQTYVMNLSGSAFSYWINDGNERQKFIIGAEFLDQLNELYFSRINLLYGVKESFSVTNIQQLCKPLYDKTIDIRPLLIGNMLTVFILLRFTNTREEGKRYLYSDRVLAQ